MKSTKKAFTLVELIVVITILAILGTIAFISLQGYSADARNSKRTSDVNNLQSTISVKQTEGASLMNFISTVAGSKLTAVNLAGSGSTATSLGSDYNAGNPNYTALGIKTEEFKDPTNNDYQIGATTYVDGEFEIVATLEEGANKSALVKGTYNSRGTGTVSLASVNTQTSGDVITVSSAGSNFFKKNDYVTLSTKGAARVTKVARDGVTLTLNVTGVLPTETIRLTNIETAGLVNGRVNNDGSADSQDIPVTTGGTEFAY